MKVFKKLFVIILLSSLILGCFPNSLFATTDDTTIGGVYMICKKDLKVYKSMRWDKDNHVKTCEVVDSSGKITPGTFVQVLEVHDTSTPTLDGHSWIKISFCGSPAAAPNVLSEGFLYVTDGVEIFPDMYCYDGCLYEKSLISSSRIFRSSPQMGDEYIKCTLARGEEIYVEGITRTTSTGHWLSVRAFSPEENDFKKGYIFSNNNGEYVDDYVLNSQGYRKMYAQGTEKKILFGDKVPVYASKSTTPGSCYELDFGEEVYVQETVLVGTSGSNYWWKISYKDKNVTKTGYCFQKAGAAPYFTNVNVNWFSSNLSERQTNIRATADVLYERGEKLQYDSADRYFNRFSFTQQKAGIPAEIIFNDPGEPYNIDCSSFAFTVFFNTQPSVKLKLYTNSLMEYAQSNYNPNDLSEVKAYMTGAEFRNAGYYNDALRVDAARFARENNVKVGDIIVTRTNGATDDEGSGHVMIVYAVQYDAAGEIKNLVLIHSTGGNDHDGIEVEEKYGTVQYISMSARFIGEKHTTNLNSIAVIRPTQDMY